MFMATPSFKLSRVAIVGHSFVNDLERFIRDYRHNSSSSKPIVSGNLGLQGCEVVFIGASGGRVCNHGTVSFLARRLSQYRRFDVVILMLGDNDVAHCGDDLEMLSSRLEAVASMLRARARAEFV